GTTLPPAREEPLPSLAESDPLVRGLLSGLTPQPPPAAWLSTQGLIERFVAAVDNVASGESPRPSLLFLAPSRKFDVLRRRDHLYVDPATYERYDAVAELASSVDPQRAVEAYRQVAPLCEEAYRGARRSGGRWRSRSGCRRATYPRRSFTARRRGEGLVRSCRARRERSDDSARRSRGEASSKRRPSRYGVGHTSVTLSVPSVT